MNLEEFRKNRKARLQRLNESLNRPFKEALENMPDITDDKAHGEVDAVEMDAIKSSKEREKQTKDALKDKNKETREFIKKQDKDREVDKEEKSENRLMLDESLFMEDYQMLSSIELTDEGLEKVNQFIAELEAKRKEILDAGEDTADETEIPTVADIMDDITWEGVDEDGEYYNGWAVTDNYDSDSPLLLKLGVDFVETHNESLIDDHKEMLNKKKDKDAVRRSNETKKKEDKKPLKEEDAEEEETDEKSGQKLKVRKDKDGKILTKYPEREKKSNAKLNESLYSDAIDVVYDLVDRAKSWIDDGDDKDEAIQHAIDDGLIYTDDIFALARYFGGIDDSELIESFYESLYELMYEKLGDYGSEAEQEDEQG